MCGCHAKLGKKKSNFNLNPCPKQMEKRLKKKKENKNIFNQPLLIFGHLHLQ